MAWQPAAEGVLLGWGEGGVGFNIDMAWRRCPCLPCCRRAGGGPRALTRGCGGSSRAMACRCPTLAMAPTRRPATCCLAVRRGRPGATPQPPLLLSWSLTGTVGCVGLAQSSLGSLLGQPHRGRAPTRCQPSKLGCRRLLDAAGHPVLLGHPPLPALGPSKQELVSCYRRLPEVPACL